MRPNVIATTAILMVCAVFPAAGQITTPEEHLGRAPGEDGFLAPWPQVVSYHEAVAAASDRVSIESAGTTTLGNDMPVVIVTSAANQAKLEHYREIARKLANADLLTDDEVSALAAEGRAIVLVTCSIHSTEVGSTQMSLELVHELATSEDPEVLEWLDEVIVLLMPSINPDGQVLVVDWYNKWLGTDFEGGQMPWLYHHYVGHDNNRDFYMLTQKETLAVNDVLYHRWFPQVYVDEHQMGSYGPRMFVPPQTDPLAEEVHPLIFRQADLLGTIMGMRLQEDDRHGVGSNMIFDSYWPGGTRNTAWWKNVTGLLTEVASAKIATPVFVDPGELRGGGKGLPEYKRRANFPSPWPGGWWRIRDIMDYELVATKALIEMTSSNRERFLTNFATMAREAARKGRDEAPTAFVVPPDQHDPVAAAKLVELMLQHGMRAKIATGEITSGRLKLPAGTVVFPAAQPYREFLLTMMRPQRYPEIIPYVGGPVLPPYDSTSWSLPISLGVETYETADAIAGELEALTTPPWPEAGSPAAAAGGWLLPHSADTVFSAVNRLLADEVELYWLRAASDNSPAGEIFIPADATTPEKLYSLADELHLPVTPLDAAPTGEVFRVNPVRVGLFKPWRASMDEGWTRFVLEGADFDNRSLHNADVKDGSFTSEVDVLLLPDVAPSIIDKGEHSSERARSWSTPLPPEYSGGIGEDGIKHVKQWVQDGGTVVAMNRSTAWAIKVFGLPVDNTLAKVSRDEFSCPGSMLRLEVDTSHPLAYGMQAEEAAYFKSSPAFRTRIPDARFERTVVARYPSDRRDILVSGYLEGGKRLARRAAVVEVKVGEGRVVLIGFRPQNRAQPHRTFKLLFNALMLAGLEEVDLQ